MILGKDSRDAGTARGSLRVKFLLLWILLCLVKIALAVQLPLMVDEAFYAWEGRHLALAYSDLPGLTAWLARLGVEMAGEGALALRLPFLLLGAWLPWLVVGISRRWFGAGCGWSAGILSMLMPLSGLLGVLAVPDVPLVIASLLCLEAVARLRERISWPALSLLALALVMGAFTHYRFALVIVAGGLGLCLDPRARRMFTDARFWWALLVGMFAWLPLLLWNLQHDGAGIRFHVVERNPWAWDIAGAWWLPIQFLLVTPALFILLLATMREAWQRSWIEPDGPWRLFLGVGGFAVWGFFILGFFADRERVSFHWPLAGWLVWVVAAPVLLQSLARWLRTVVTATTLAGLSATLALLVIAASPTLRNTSAGRWWYPSAFAGSDEIVAKIRREKIPASTRLVADNVGLAAQFAFAMPERDIQVLDHPRNHKHGRATQLQLWGQQLEASTEADDRPSVLVLEDSARPLKQRLVAYHALCAAMAGLPPVEVFNVDHGRKRYLLFRIESGQKARRCVLPALAWIDTPQSGAVQRSAIDIRGWAFKDGAGIARVEILLDGVVVTEADYGASMPNVAAYWKISNDPAHPGVGFRAHINLADSRPGRHWLGLRLHGKDGSREDWPEQPLDLSR